MINDLVTAHVIRFRSRVQDGCFLSSELAKSSVEEKVHIIRPLTNARPVIDCPQLCSKKHTRAAVLYQLLAMHVSIGCSTRVQLCLVAFHCVFLCLFVSQMHLAIVSHCISSSHCVFLCLIASHCVSSIASHARTKEEH